MSELEQLAELIGQRSEVIVVQHELAEAAQVPDLSGQGAQLVVGEVEPAEVVEEGDGGGEPEQGVVVEIERGEVLQLPQRRGQVLDGAGDLQLGPARRLAVGDILGTEDVVRPAPVETLQSPAPAYQHSAELTMEIFS